MEDCKQVHAENVTKAVGELPKTPDHGLFVHRCAHCAWEEGYIAGVASTAQNVYQAAVQLRAGRRAAQGEEVPNGGN